MLYAIEVVDRHGRQLVLYRQTDDPDRWAQLLRDTGHVVGQVYEYLGDDVTPLA